MSHILVNVAWPYANGPRHIGHVAGSGVPSDVYARYERMKGNDGTDHYPPDRTIGALISSCSLICLMILL